MNRKQPAPLLANAEDGDVVIEGQGVAATMPGPIAAATARALADAAEEAERQAARHSESMARPASG